MALPVFRAAGTKAAVTTAAVSVPLPAGLQANDICILTATTIAGGSVTITVAGSITWNAITNVDVTAGEKVYMWWGRYVSGTTAPSVQAGGDHCCAGIVAYSGCITSGTPYEQLTTGSETTSDTSFSFATGGTTTGTDRMCIVCVTSGQDSNTGQFAGAFTNASLSAIATRMNFGTSSGGGGGFGIAQGALATAGSMGTWAETLATAHAKAYISLALVPPAPAIDLVIADASNESTIDSISITQVHVLTVSDSANDSTIDAITITQEHNLIIQDIENGSTVDGPITIEQFAPAINLTIQDIENGSSIDPIEISQVHILTIQDAANASTIDNVQITQVHSILINDLSNSSTIDQIAITQVHSLQIADLSSASQIDSIQITQEHQLAVQDVSNSSTIDSIEIQIGEAAIELIIDDISNESAIDAIQITQNHVLVFADLSNGSGIDAISISQVHVLAIADTWNESGIEPISITQAHNIAIADIENQSTIDNIVLIGDPLIIILATSYITLQIIVNSFLSREVDLLCKINTNFTEDSFIAHRVNDKSIITNTIKNE